METTTNLGLKKPDVTDRALIGDINDNMDNIDEAVGEIAGDVENVKKYAPTRQTVIDGTLLDDFWNGTIMGTVSSTIHGIADTYGVVRAYDVKNNVTIQVVEFEDGTVKTRSYSSGTWHPWVSSSISSAERAQIETNKNNISSVQEQANWNTNNGVKNRLNYTGFNTDNSAGVSPLTTKNVTYKKNADGTISVYTTAAGANGNAFCYLCDANGNINFKQYFDGKHILSCDAYRANHYALFYKIDSETSVAVNGDTLLPNRNDITNVSVILQVYSGEIISESTPIVFKPMIRLSSISDSTYQPYTLPNLDLTVLSAEDRAALVELVDGGAKNTFQPIIKTVTTNGVRFVADGEGTITMNGTATNDAIFFISESLSISAGDIIYGEGSIDGSVTNGWFMDLYEPGYTNRRLSLRFFSATENSKIWRLIVKSGATMNNVVFRYMICSKVAWDISQAYQPYRPSYQELYERVVALEQVNQ